MQLNARLANARALSAASAMECCDYLQSPGMMPCFLDDFSQMPTWTGGEDIPDCDKSTASVESSSNASASHYEIMTASSDKVSHMYGLGSVCTYPNRQSLQTAPAPVPTSVQTWFWEGTLKCLNLLIYETTTSTPAVLQSAGGQPCCHRCML